MMSDLAGISIPKIDWDSSSLPDAWRKFQHHAELIFKGPLKGKDEDVDCNYLLLWVGDKGTEIFHTWNLSNDDAKKLQKYYDSFKLHCQPKLNPVFSR
jgi:hypothetical protein